MGKVLQCPHYTYRAQIRSSGVQIVVHRLIGCPVKSEFTAFKSMACDANAGDAIAIGRTLTNRLQLMPDSLWRRGRKNRLAFSPSSVCSGILFF